MKIICFATLKGGAGKTMNAFQMSAVLSEETKVLLLDGDPQSNLTNDCGINISNRQRLSFVDILENKPKEQPEPERVVIKMPIHELPNLDLLPSSIKLFGTDMKLWQRGQREFILKNYINTHRDFFDQYDYIICDTNPSMSIININIFAVSDKIILTTDVSTNSMDGAEMFAELWDERREDLNIEDNIDGLLVSNFAGRSNLAQELLDYVYIDSPLADIAIKTQITTTVKLKESEAEHKPINVVTPVTKKTKEAAGQYRAVIKELKERGVL